MSIYSDIMVIPKVSVKINDVIGWEMLKNYTLSGDFHQWQVVLVIDVK